MATLAPGLTFWDAGELIAAAHTAGIPHPPGTPLWVLAARVASDAAGWLPRARGTALFSAACTAAAGALLCAWLTRSTRHWAAALGGALTAGAMSTVWLNANETEVYSAALLLSMTALVAADCAGRTGEPRWLALTAYLLALAVPLHLSALVVAPGAIALAAQDERGWLRWSDLLLLSAVVIMVAGVGTASLPLGIAGGLCVTAVLFQRHRERRQALMVPLAALLAISAILVLPARALHDPWLNEGDPRSWTALWDVIGRRQYGGLPLWPRQAPFWAQLGNLFEYADWQVGLGLAPGVAPAWLRTPFTLLFAVLGVVGSGAHRRLDRRSWRAMWLLFCCASAGLVVYLNFKAGASFGYGLLPSRAPHEVRERDYFFALAFWLWGAWAGFGAVVALAQRGRWGVATGLILAATPVALNWHATDRSRAPESALPERLAEALLWGTPPRSILVTSGDNDSFPLWYLQAVEGRRPDVTVVVAPLLGAPWYRAQLARRDDLLEHDAASGSAGERVLLRSVADHARAQGRPVAVALTAGSALRRSVGSGWVLRGLTFVEVSASSQPMSPIVGAPVDTAVAAEFVRRFPVLVAPGTDQIDPMAYLASQWLACPGRALAQARGTVRADSLDSACNFQ